jgi:hypothetical protein
MISCTAVEIQANKKKKKTKKKKKKTGLHFVI